MVFRAGLWVLGVKAPSVPLGQLPRERGSGVSQKLPLPLPRFRGFGACADAAEGGEGVSSSTWKRFGAHSGETGYPPKWGQRK